MSRTVLPGEALRAATTALRSDPAAVVLVDGRSGSGKSTLAGRLAGSTGTRLLRLDDLYPGWDGLETTSVALVERVLVPRARGTVGRLPRWDWVDGRAGAPVVIPLRGPLVVEGCGALTRGSVPFAALALWLDLDAATRRERALARDGEAFRPHWSRWAHQEARLLAREGSDRLADLRVDARALPGADAPPPLDSLAA